MKLSIVIITHNPLEILTINNNQIPNPLVDEVVIVSTNKSVMSLKQPLGRLLRIYYHVFNNNFPEVKNYGISKANGEWIFTVDTDEMLEEGFLENIDKITKNGERRIDAYWFRRKTYIDNRGKYLKHGLFYPDWQLRLFRKRTDYIYSGGVHATLPIPESKTKKILLDILHYPSKPKYESFSNFTNFYPYIKIDSQELLKKNYSRMAYILKGIYLFCFLFLSGFIRGRGFLDGWAGFRAHLLFAISIAAGYFVAAYQSLRGWL